MITFNEIESNNITWNQLDKLNLTWNQFESMAIDMLLEKIA